MQSVNFWRLLVEVVNEMDTAVRIACIFASLPRPPGVLLYNELYVQAIPLARFNKLCGNVNRDIRFELFASSNNTAGLNFTKELLRIDDGAALNASQFDRHRPTVLYLHGFGESSVGPSSLAVRDAFLARGGYNVIMVDHMRITASPWYDTAVANSFPIGGHIGRFVDFLVSQGMSLSSLHVVGISLGAQVAAVVASAVRSGRIGRITGLDPALPGFVNWPETKRLSKASARFVDVIHTDTTTFGVNSSVGHVDFYPNGGVAPQPRCQLSAAIKRKASPIEIVFCSHLQSYLLFAKSLLHDKAFPATPCSSWKKFRQGTCVRDKRRRVYMGIATPKWARGNYYLSTVGYVQEIIGRNK